MLQKKQYVTPSTRFASVLRIIDTDKKYPHKLRHKKNYLPKKKVFSPTHIYTPHNQLKFNWGLVVKKFVYNFKPFQTFLICKSLYGNQLILPGTEWVRPGQKVFNLAIEIGIKKIKYLGSQIQLENLPFFMNISCITNNLNTKITYIRASGTYGIKLKPKKTIKLIVVKLPSEKEYYFFGTTLAFIGKTTNFYNNKYVEGK